MTYILHQLGVIPIFQVFFSHLEFRLQFRRDFEIQYEI